MRIAIYIIVVVSLAYLAMLVTTVVRDSQTSIAPAVEPIVSSAAVEVQRGKWESALLRPSKGGDDLKLNYDKFRPEAIGNFSPSSRYVVAANGVGRIQFEIKADEGDPVVVACRAILISPDQVLTAAHCLEPKEAPSKPGSPAKIQRAAIRFGLLDDNVENAPNAGLLYELNKDPIDKDRLLDFAVFSLAPSAATAAAAAGFRPVRLSRRDIVAGTDAFVIGHPLAWPLNLSRANCRITALNADPQTKKVRHSCGTAPGVSGAPIFDDATCEVVALHVEAPNQRKNDRPSVGYGVPIIEIAAKSAAVRHILEATKDQAVGCASSTAATPSATDSGPPPTAPKP